MKPVVTIAVWQTLLDESLGFVNEVKRGRVACVQEAAMRSANVCVDFDTALAALECAADRFEAAYLCGAPIQNVERARLIGEALGLQLGTDEQQALAVALGQTHSPTSLQPRPGARRMLRELARDNRIVALSDTWMSPGSTLRASLKHHALAQFLSGMLFSDETKVYKVTGEAWSVAAQRFGTRVEQIVHVGDLPVVDGAVALAVGCAGSIVVSHSDHPVKGVHPSECAGVHVVTDSASVPPLVERLRRGEPPFGASFPTSPGDLPGQGPATPPGS